MNRSTRSVPGLMTVRPAARGPAVAETVRAAQLAAHALAARARPAAAQPAAPIGEPPRPDRPAYVLGAKGPACPPTG